MKVESLAAFLFVFLLASCAPQRVAAQFLGYTSPQTVQQQVFNNIAVPAVSATIQNIGQTMHYVFYRTTNTTALEVVIEADPGDGTWVEISNRATASTSGFVYASGYYPRTRARVLTLVGANPTLSAWYFGTSSAMGPEAGRFRSSGTEVALVALNRDATVQAISLPVTAPLRSSEGSLFFVPSVTAPITGVTSLTGARLTVWNSSSPQMCGNAVSQQVGEFGPLAELAGAAVFSVPAFAAAYLCMDYRFAAAPTGGLYSIYYAFGSTSPPEGVSYPWAPPLIASGTTSGVAVKYAKIKSHTISLIVTGAPATCTAQLEGSVDSTNGVDGTWFALSGAVDCTVAANRMFHVVNKPVSWVRGNLTALAGGAAPSVDFEYFGVR